MNEPRRVSGKAATKIYRRIKTQLEPQSTTLHPQIFTGRMTIISEDIVDSLKIEGVQLLLCGSRVVYSTKPIGRKGDAMVSIL